MGNGKHFSDGKRNATRAYAATGRDGFERAAHESEKGSFDARRSADSAGVASSAAPNTTDPFSPDYVDPALTVRQRKKEQKRQIKAAKRRVQAGEPAGSNGRVWTFLYVLAALVITVLVWFLLGGGV